MRHTRYECVKMNTELFQYALTVLYAYIHVFYIILVQYNYYTLIKEKDWPQKVNARIFGAPHSANKSETESSAF